MNGCKTVAAQHRFKSVARILLAEDDAISRLYMSESLSRSGHEAARAKLGP